jgi:hypothetical protein
VLLGSTVPGLPETGAPGLQGSRAPRNWCSWAPGLPGTGAPGRQGSLELVLLGSRVPGLPETGAPGLQGSRAPRNWCSWAPGFQGSLKLVLLGSRVPGLPETGAPGLQGSLELVLHAGLQSLRASELLDPWNRGSRSPTNPRNPGSQGTEVPGLKDFKAPWLQCSRIAELHCPGSRGLQDSSALELQGSRPPRLHWLWFQCFRAPLLQGIQSFRAPRLQDPEKFCTRIREE